ncbi:MAG: hypothetical protein NVS2B14_19030 [Chamaesiphon sp.]
MSLGRISALAVLMLTLASNIAMADTNPQGTHNQQHPRGMHQKHGDLMQQLNLTQAQQQQLQTIRNQYKQQMAPTQQALRQAEQKLTDLMTGAASDNEISNQYKQVQQLRQQLADLRFQSMLAIRGVLTTEQRQKFASFMQQHRQHFRQQGVNPKGFTSPKKQG